MNQKEREHNPPHVHAVMQDCISPFSIQTGELLTGEFPPKAKKLVKDSYYCIKRNWRKCGSQETSENFHLLNSMFHRVVEWKICEGTTIEALFQDGVVKRYDVEILFEEYSQFTALKDRSLFEHPQIKGAYLLVWNDELDLGSETVYMEGETIGKEEMPIKDQVGAMITEARWSAGLSQTQLGKLAKVDQADVSKLEVGEANPTITTLDRIARAMGKKLKITIE